MFVAIVPVYNEEETIGSVVRSLFHHVDQVVVVDDGSSDATAKEARLAGATVLSHEINRGQGAALQTGQDYALSVGADFVLHFDGDAQFDPADIAPALAELKNKQADILFGSRFLSDNQQIPWLKRQIILPLARVFNKVFFGIKLSDAHNGFRILNQVALQKIKITQDRMAHSTEIPAQVFHLGLKWVEFPVKVVYREYGQGVGGGVKIIRDLILGKFTK